MSFTEHPLATSRGPVRRQLSRDDIRYQGRVLMNAFILRRLQQDNVANILAVTALQEPDTPSGPPLENAKDITDALMFIADELDQDRRTECIIQRVPPDAPMDTFFDIADGMFEDGVLSWGRVVTLFYFGYKMALKALDRIPLFKAIINGVINFIVDRFAAWIIERGGWEMIVEYFGTPGWLTAVIFMGGFVTAAGIVAYKTW